MSLLQATLPLYKFKIHIQACSPIEFYNFPGIALRGGFGWMLKQQTCLEKGLQTCKECQFIQYCPYASIFESHNLGNAGIMKEATNFPHPFVLAPVLQWPGIVQPGESFIVYLSIFGEAIKYFHFFIKALKSLGQKGIGKKGGKYIITGIQNYNSDEILYTEKEGYKSKEIEGLFIPNTKVDSLNIQFITPCEIKHNGMIIQRPTVEVLVKNILRKYKIISNIYADNFVLYNEDGINYDSIEVVDVNTQWYATDRRSKRQNRVMKIQGFTGSMTVKGDVTKLYSILKIGEIIHIGKHTSFGCGLLQVTKN
ncbi:MAG: CRISPR system precrRNA processing endoribonuclease RAMP protein Cas6 [Spirochaetes bacterium]|nr:CRISPR system precrRNA processing endoribonuclease RAMP protein Cas6 [Spirochaetota bacterium]